MTCPNCGATVADNRRFCGKCGTSLTTETAPGAAAQGLPGAPPSTWGTGGALAPPPPAAAPPPGAAPTGPTDPFAPPDLNPPPYAPPGYSAPPPGYPQEQAGYGPPPGYPPAGYPPPPGYPPPGYAGAPPPPGAWAPYGYAPTQTNGLSVASLVLGLIGWTFCGIGSVVAIVLGFAARNQIKSSGGRQIGSGMATAGITLGFIGAGFWLFVFLVNLVDNTH
jgi:hypothetical protein